MMRNNTSDVDAITEVEAFIKAHWEGTVRVNSKTKIREQ
jgi:hypothetical protein